LKQQKKYGVDITNQRGRQFVVSDFDDFDYIYAMDSTNFNDIISLSRNINDASKIKLILDELADVDTADVPDHYYGGSQGFENVYRILDSACNIIANKLK
jgi:protein-tyrosine phosphatase